MMLSMFLLQCCSVSGSYLHPKASPATSHSIPTPDQSGLLSESRKTYRRSWWSLRSRGARHLESNTREVPVNPAAGEGELLSGEGRAQAAAELCQAWKPGLPPRAVLGSGSNPGQSSQEAAAGCWGGLLWQLQRLRWKESSDFYFIFFRKRSTSTTVPLLLQGFTRFTAKISKYLEEGCWPYTHKSTDSPWGSSLQGATEVKSEL